MHTFISFFETMLPTFSLFLLKFLMKLTVCVNSKKKAPKCLLKLSKLNILYANMLQNIFRKFSATFHVGCECKSATYFEMFNMFAPSMVQLFLLFVFLVSHLGDRWQIKTLFTTIGLRQDKTVQDICLYNITMSFDSSLC